jgi:phosphoesterase RecJ-like protein
MSDITHAQAWDRLRAMDNILILAHAKPDGDAVGSMFALYHALRQCGKRVRCEIIDVPASLRFVVAPEAFADFEPAHVVTVDVADRKLLNDCFKDTYGGRVELSIDHHGVHTPFAEETLVDPSAAAASEVLFDLFTVGGVTLTKEIATCLYLGLSTDTGCFRFANTTAKTLRTAAALLEAGVDNGALNADIFETKSAAYIAFEKAAMNALTICLGGKCAVLVLTQQMYRDAGITEADTQGIKGLPRMIEGVYAGVTVTEQKDGKIHASVRSKEPVNAAEICAAFGGGGHRYAAGCELSSDRAVAVSSIVAAVEQKLRETGLL